MAVISSAKHSSGNEDGNTACVSTASTNVPTASASVATISQDTACAYVCIRTAFSILSEPFVCAYWKIWATSSLSDLIQIISQSSLLDSEWIREVLGLSPNVGLEALRSTAALPRHGKGSWDKEKKEKVQGEMSSKELVKTRFFSTGHGVKLEGSMNYAKGKSWALLLFIYKWSRERAPLEQKA
nr:subtilisin-like serine endopeptidase family protein [Tanacetum cinerariifolium]